MNNAVTITITSKGWETKAEINGEIFIENHKSTNSGSVSVGDLLSNNKNFDDDLSEAISDLILLDIVKELQISEDL